MFQGPTGKALSYFNSIGYICPATKDPADFLVAVSGWV